MNELNRRLSLEKLPEAMLFLVLTLLLLNVEDTAIQLFNHNLFTLPHVYFEVFAAISFIIFLVFVAASVCEWVNTSVDSFFRISKKSKPWLLFIQVLVIVLYLVALLLGFWSGILQNLNGIANGNLQLTFILVALMVTLIVSYLEFRPRYERPSQGAFSIRADSETKEVHHSGAPSHTLDALYLRSKRWFCHHFDLEHWFFVIILVIGLALICVVICTNRGLYGGDVFGNYLYLLSSIVQALATILALLVTISLIATQLAAGAYTPNAVRYRLRDSWFWFAVFIYLLAISWSLIVLNNPGGLLYRAGRDHIDVALILAGVALFYIVPFTLATLRSLQPYRIAEWLVSRNDYRSLDELVRRAVNDGMNTVVTDSLQLVTSRAYSRLDAESGSILVANQLTKLYISVGRHSCQRRSPDAFGQVLQSLTALIRYCNQPPRSWRQAADIFNETAIELYLYSREWIRESV